MMLQYVVVRSVSVAYLAMVNEVRYTIFFNSTYMWDNNESAQVYEIMKEYLKYTDMLDSYSKK